MNSCFPAASSGPPTALLGESSEQPRGDAFPRPALDRDAPRGLAEARALGRRKSQQVAELRRELLRVSRREARELAALLGIGRLEAFRHLGETRVARDERRAT